MNNNQSQKFFKIILQGIMSNAVVRMLGILVYLRVYINHTILTRNSVTVIIIMIVILSSCSVFSESECHSYCHHEILINSYPLTLEWLDYDPEEPDVKGISSFIIFIV